MIYLETITFPSADQEFDFFLRQKRTCYDSYYPFGILSKHRLERMDFEPITILYGGNGTGKSTALNIIAEKLELTRDSAYNRSNFYPDYLQFCRAKTSGKKPADSRIITSDDVFDYMLNIRALNEGLDGRREELFQEYLDAKYSDFHMESMADYERLKKVNFVRKKTQSKFIRAEMMDNVREYSNGESAFRYFVENIQENGLYLLDEPENSLSPERQQELVRVLEDSARFFGCQFIISTHSPFVLAARQAKIYDLDQDPVDVRRWTELENVQRYYQFFREHQWEFER